MVIVFDIVFLISVLLCHSCCSSSTLSPSVSVTTPVPDEQRLYTDLMSYYESSVRPVLNASTIINVNFQLTLNQIVDLVSNQNLEDRKMRPS